MHINRMIVLQTMIAGIEALPDGFASLEAMAWRWPMCTGSRSNAIPVSDRRLTDNEAEKVARLIVRLFAQMGMLDQARRWAERGMHRLAATPGGALAIAEGRVIQALLDNIPFRRQEDRDHFADGMRKAGVPG
jgi:hypothetical protein